MSIANEDTPELHERLDSLLEVYRRCHSDLILTRIIEVVERLDAIELAEMQEALRIHE